MIISFCGNAQIKEGITYTEDEIAIQDKYVEAKKYVLIGRFEKAEEILKQLYNDDRKNPAVATELSKVYGYLEDPFNEFKYAQTAYENATNNEFVIINYANICMAQEKFDDAIAPLKKLVLAHPSAEVYSDKLATSYLQINDADAALTTYSNLEKQIGITENVSRRQYEIYEILGEQKKALNELEKLSNAFPLEIRYLHNLASYYTKLDKESKALDVYRRILEIDINDASANMAITASNTGKGDDNSYLRSLTPVIENKSIPVDRKILELIPFIDQLNTSYDQELADALIMLSEKITINHSSEAKSFALFGDILLSTGRVKDAAKAYEKTLSMNDNIYPVWEGLMECYTEAKENEKLLKTSTDALDLFPNKASAYMYYGRANTLNGDFTEAIDLLNEGILVSGKNIYTKSNILAELARANAASGNMQSAEKNIDQALEMSNNKNGLALEIFGDMLYQKGNTEGALEQWKSAQNNGVRSKRLIEKIELKKL
ncbi:MAG: tetratricopeptide repeat protein [Saprospiraceae bacterium]|nr:tetratricopeptide repeat protein [Saprospiraceae bacterium]